MPAPARETDWGLPSALSVIKSIPVRVPVVVGVKLTLMLQLAADVRLRMQLSVSPKYVVALMDETFSRAVP